MRSAAHLVALATLVACRPTATGEPTQAPDQPAGETTVGYPGTLQPPSAMGPDIQWQQRVTAQWGTGRARGFDAVLSKADDELLLIGLSPMKAPGFVLRLHDGQLEFENRSPEKLPFEPRYIMLDVQRVFFPWIPGPSPSHGMREHARHGERIVEHWRDGHLAERRFSRLDGAPAGEIVVRYEDWQPGADAPRRAVLDNGWFGYRLEIETYDQQRL